VSGMMNLTLNQWWKVFLEVLRDTDYSLFQAVDFMIGKYGEPNQRENISQKFEDTMELD